MTAYKLIAELRHAPRGLTIDEIAERLGCSTSSAKRKLRQARDALPAIWTIEAMTDTWKGCRVVRYHLVRDWGVAEEQLTLEVEA